MADKKVKNYKKVDSRTALQDDREEKLERIKKILPHLVNGDNKLDVEALKDVLEDSVSTTGQGYNLNFAGKGLARIKADEPTKKELRLEEEQSKSIDKTENVIIRGDNLDVLKVLWNNYYGKIKMIYIDPPYNTDNDSFIYCDSFKETEAELIEKYGITEEQINFFENMFGTKTHSGWLYFMYPRLKLARDLLTDDGAIFISIDDNEQANLKLLCDDIFHAKRFITAIPRMTSAQRSGQENHMNVSHDYVLCYSYSEDFEKVINRDLSSAEIKSDKNGTYIEGDTKAILAAQSQGYSEGCDYDFTYQHKIYKPVNKDGERNRWLWGEERMKAAAELGILVPTKNSLRMQVYLDKKFEEKTNKLVDKDESLIFHTADFMRDKKYSNPTGTKQLSNLFGKHVFSNPKPVDLLLDIIKLSTEDGDLILDFFAGSGTTAQAVMQLNKENDVGRRKFILAQQDEKIDEKKNQVSRNAYNFCEENKLKPLVSSICIERVNLAGEKAIKNKKVDTGYKVFSLVDHPDVITSETSEQNHFNINRVTIKDTLYNMMVASREALLSDVIEEIEKDNLYKVRDSYYLLRKCETNLKDKKFNKIFVDGYADINLEDWLNLLGLGEDKVEILY